MEEAKIWPKQVEGVYRQDLMDKTITAKSARSRVGSNGVRMPSDSLSRKERQELNGEVKTYHIGKPMTLEEYNALPEDIQELYRKRHGQAPASEEG